MEKYNSIIRIEVPDREDVIEDINYILDESVSEEEHVWNKYVSSETGDYPFASIEIRNLSVDAYALEEVANDIRNNISDRSENYSIFISSLDLELNVEKLIYYISTNGNLQTVLMSSERGGMVCPVCGNSVDKAALTNCLLDGDGVYTCDNCGEDSNIIDTGIGVFLRNTSDGFKFTY